MNEEPGFLKLSAAEVSQWLAQPETKLFDELLMRIRRDYIHEAIAMAASGVSATYQAAAVQVLESVRRYMRGPTNGMSAVAPLPGDDDDFVDPAAPV